MKYNIEGNVDFYAELNKPLIPDVNVDDTGLCLITRLPLTDDSVKLECGHKFNYLPLYNDLVQQTKPSICGYAKSGRIVCPFCRHSQQTLLPFNVAYKPILGVNLYPGKLCKDANVKRCYTKDACEMFVFINFCTSEYTYKLSNGKHYCEGHKFLGLSIAKQEEMHDAFVLKTQTAETKLSKKIAEKEAKQKEKLDKVAKKELAKNLAKSQLHDIIQSVPAPINETIACTALIKTGPKKGQLCGCKKVIDGICLRHKQVVLSEH